MMYYPSVFTTTVTNGTKYLETDGLYLNEWWFSGCHLNHCTAEGPDVGLQQSTVDYTQQN